MRKSKRAAFTTFPPPRELRSEYQVAFCDLNSCINKPKVHRTCTDGLMATHTCVFDDLDDLTAQMCISMYLEDISTLPSRPAPLGASSSDEAVALQTFEADLRAILRPAWFRRRPSSIRRQRSDHRDSAPVVHEHCTVRLCSLWRALRRRAVHSSPLQSLLLRWMLGRPLHSCHD